MPDRLGPWSTVCQRFRGWRNLGTSDQIFNRLHLRLNERA
ncbi:transposase [Pseudomonas syringae pv. dysoxyli]|nr:transposase [Pseudomonas syringae pv. dysoxyli]